PQALKHLNTATSRHVDIEQNQLRSGTQRSHPCLQRVPGKDWLKVARTQERGEQLSLEARVVGDQNFRHDKRRPDEAQLSGMSIGRMWISVRMARTPLVGA